MTKELFDSFFEFDKKWNKFQVQMEFALGNYDDPDKKLGYGEAILLNIKTIKHIRYH